MKKSRPNVYCLKLTNFELRVMVNVLNERRLKMNANGEDPTTYPASFSNALMHWNPNNRIGR